MADTGEHNPMMAEDETPTASRFKGSVKDYLLGNVSRRAFFTSAVSLGVGVTVAGRMAEALAEPADDLAASAGPGLSRIATGRGGDICVEQLRSAGVEFIFTNPSTGGAPIFDNLIGRDDMHVIMCPHEGSLTAMADGYAKASGKVAFVSVSRPGSLNTHVNLFNSFHDRVPVIVEADQAPEDRRGRFSFQEVDDLVKSAEPYTRWAWETRRADAIAADVRRSFKFALTPPRGPVFLSIPEDLFYEKTEARIVDISQFTLSDSIRADQPLMDDIARRLIAAKSPVLYAGDDIFVDDAESEVVALAELLSIPTVQPGKLWQWANNFPTDHPLYLGEYVPNMRYPRNVDLILNLGGQLPVGPGDLSEGVDLIEAGSDIERMGRVFPGSHRVHANLKLFARDLIAAIRKQAGKAQIRQWSETRGKATAEFSARLRQTRELAAANNRDSTPISVDRVGMEFSAQLDKDAILVSELDGARPAISHLTFGKGKMGYFSTTGLALGWGLGASAGVKLAQPGRQVVTMVGDGAFLFAGSQALWSMARYKIPVIVVVMNNRSYDAERSRIWARDSRQAEAKKDMTCYLGDPDVDFVSLARAYGVEGARVATPDALQAAIRQAIETTRGGRPFLLDINIERRGLGKDVVWYPDYSVAAQA